MDKKINLKFLIYPTQGPQFSPYLIASMISSVPTPIAFKKKRHSPQVARFVISYVPIKKEIAILD